MEMPPACIALAAIVLLVLLVIVFFRRVRARNRSSDGFMPGDPATPKLREGATMIERDLSCISETAARINLIGEQIDRTYDSLDMGNQYNEARLSLAGARQGMTAIVGSIRSLQASIGIMTPTYQNVLSLYRGLQNSDQSLRQAAQNLGEIGGRIEILVDGPEQTNTELNQKLRTAGGHLKQIGSCFHMLIRSVHYVGNSLGLE